jgi:hypothetical protein
MMLELSKINVLLNYINISMKLIHFQDKHQRVCIIYILMFTTGYRRNPIWVGTKLLKLNWNHWNKAYKNKMDA